MSEAVCAKLLCFPSSVRRIWERQSPSAPLELRTGQHQGVVVLAAVSLPSSLGTLPSLSKLKTSHFLLR